MTTFSAREAVDARFFRSSRPSGAHEVEVGDERISRLPVRLRHCHPHLRALEPRPYAFADQPASLKGASYTASRPATRLSPMIVTLMVEGTAWDEVVRVVGESSAKNATTTARVRGIPQR